LFVGVSVALLAVPGPAVLYIVTRSVDQGRAAGLMSMLGIETGTLAYALAAAAGLSGLIAASSTAFATIRYAGAVYLVYLGIRKLVEPEDPHELAPVPSRLFLNGLLVQVFNPKVAIFFVALLPQFVDSARGPIAAQMLVLGSTFTLLALLTDSAYALAAAALRGWFRGGTRARRRLAKLSGGVYVGLGVYAALSGTGHSKRS
jgi:threonine/homoserine/homoserine lactone efflux protein